MPDCPHCGHRLTPTEIRELLKSTRANKRMELAGDVLQSKRKTRGGGRPPSPERCPCGEFTLARAAARSHKCTAS